MRDKDYKQYLESLALQAGIKRKKRMQHENINDNEGTVAEPRGSAGTQAMLNMPFMCERRTELLPSPQINKGEQQVTAALAEGSKTATNPTYEQFDQWACDKESICPRIIKQALRNSRHLFIHKLLPSLPPEKVIDHTITLVSKNVANKGAV